MCVLITELESNSTLNADVWETAGLHGNATFPLEHFSYNNSALLDVIFRHVQDTKFNGITVSGRRRKRRGHDEKSGVERVEGGDWRWEDGGEGSQRKKKWDWKRR